MIASAATYTLCALSITPIAMLASSSRSATLACTRCLGRVGRTAASVRNFSSFSGAGGASNQRRHVKTSQTSLSLRSFATQATPIRSQPRTSSITVLGKEYPTDDYTNLSSTIVSRLQDTPQLPQTASHPLQLLCRQIQRSLPDFTVVKAPSPIVSVDDNFGSLGFPEDHPGRSPSDTYYLNRQTCLRTHTSTHEVQTFAEGHTKWLLTADVFRRDEIDASHYPVFHQMEGACVRDLQDYEQDGVVEQECVSMERRLNDARVEIEDDVDLKEAGGYQPAHERDPRKQRAAQLAMRHLKATLNNLVLDLFGERHASDVAASSKSSADASEPLKVRWIAASFPFTSPSFEIEVMFRGKWLEILGCGVVMERTLENARVQNKLGWAFGLGLERIAMVLFQIPDIRLFWSTDPRFLSQFAESQPSKENGAKAGVSPAGGATAPPTSDTAAKLPLITFKAYSRYPPCYRDISFWLPQASATSKLHDNDVFEVIRDVAGDLTEDVLLIDEYVHPKTQRASKCFRVNYRSMDRNLSNDEVNIIHQGVTERLVNELAVELR